MEEGNVSRAAERLALSQPALSAVLNRLRQYFGDRILVPQGHRMYPTPFAESLLPQVRLLLQSAEALVQSNNLFDPATSARTFRVIASDYILAAVLSPMVQKLAQTAPNLRFDFLPLDDTTVEKLGRGEADLIITPQEYQTGEQISELLYEERFVVAGCRRNPLFPQPLTEALVMAQPHVAVTVGARRVVTYADMHLSRLGKERNIVAVVPAFTMAPWLLVGTSRLAFMHERLARAMSVYFPITFAELPFAFPNMRQMLQYHRTRADDAGLQWLRDQLKAHAADGIEADYSALSDH
jgi:LysR family transcriptional regulator, nod-box dependent transcriptional activator